MELVFKNFQWYLNCVIYALKNVYITGFPFVTGNYFYLYTAGIVLDFLEPHQNSFKYVT